MPSASSANAYVLVPAQRWGRLRASALACVLALLQGCRTGDAVAPESRGIEATLSAPVPANLRLLTDTAVVGEPLHLSGEQLPANASLVRVTLDNVPLPVKGVSVSSIEVAVTGDFPCRATSPAQLVVEVGSVSFRATLPLRTAQRIDLRPGDSHTMPSVQRSACVELVASAGPENAQYVVAVVNTSHEAGASPSYTLRGTGLGAMSGLASQEQPPGAAALRSAPAGPLDQPALPHVSDDRHAHLLDQQRTIAGTAGAAKALWQARTALRSGVAMMKRAVAEGDTTVLMAINGSCHRGHAVKARVVYAGSRAVVLEDVTAPRAGTMDDTYRQIGDEYERVMHPLLVESMGDPLAMNGTMGGDGRVVMLFTRFVNDSMSGTAGYVSACNFYPRATFGGSNEAAVVYGRVPSLHESPSEWRRAMRGTVVHEAKHLASFAERLVRGRDFEEPWLEEATARVAEELYARTFVRGAAWRSNTGFAESVQCEVTQCDDRPLVMWKHFSGLHAWLRNAGSVRVGQVTGEAGAALSATEANAGYASGWALVRWVLDRRATSERDALRVLVAGSSSTGLRALASAAGLSEQALLTQWALEIGTTTALRASAFSVPPSSWGYQDIIGGMASMFPGVFSAQPLSASRRSIGSFALANVTMSGTAQYVTLEGDLSRAGQLLHLTTSDSGALGLAVYRAE